jgi:hypothetical protein
MGRAGLAALTAVLGVVACDGGPVSPVPVGHTGTITGDDDDTPTPTVLGDDEASIVLTIQQPSVANPDGSTSLTGLFVESDRGWLNLVECFTWFCTDQLPAGPGDSVIVQGVDQTLRDDLASRDVGNRITLGDLSARKQEDGAFLFYATTEVGPTDLGTRPMGLSFGGAWGDYVGADDVIPPTPMIASQPSTTETLEFLSSDLIHFEWEPGTRGDVFLLVTTRVESRLHQLEDLGSFDLDLSGLGLADDELVSLDLGRWSQGGVDHEGNVASIFVKSNQHFEGRWRNIGGRLPLYDIYDTCAEAEVGVPLAPGNYVGDITSFANDLRPRSGVCTPWTAAGQDGIVPLDLLDDQQVEIDYRIPNGDASVYLTTDCADLGECFAGRDATLNGGTESLTYVNDQGDRRVYLVLDGFDTFQSGFSLDVEITSLGGSILVDTCAEAIAQGPAAPGSYQGRIGGNANLLEPVCSPNSSGGEGITQVFLLPGETLEAQVTTNGSPNAAMYLLYNCSIADSCLTGVAPSKNLVYQNQTGASEFLYLVLDGPPGLDSYVLDLLVY